MKKLMTIALLMAVATAASARGEYGKANRELAMCKGTAQVATLFYSLKIKNAPILPDDTEATSKYLWKINNDVNHYAYEKATSGEDAYMYALTFCLDNINRAFLDKCGIFSCNNLREEAKN